MANGNAAIDDMVERNREGKEAPFCTILTCTFAITARYCNLR